MGEGDLFLLTSRLMERLRSTNDPPRLFRYARLPARIEQDDEENRKTVVVLDVAGMTNEIAKRIRCVRVTQFGPEAVPPPRHLVVNYMANEDLSLPPLRGVTEVPVFAANGELVLQEGYHGPSGLYYGPAPGLTIKPVPAWPSNEDVREARRLLEEELLGQFPWVDLSDKTNALALGFEQFVRPMIQGCMPLHLFHAPSPGTGKGLAPGVLAIPYAGGLSESPLPATEEERRKAITSVARKAAPFYLLDNVTQAVDSGVLSAAITSLTWEDRILGQTAMLRAPIRWSWIMTGNNVVISTELMRHSAPSRLERHAARGGPQPRDMEDGSLVGTQRPSPLRQQAEQRQQVLDVALATLMVEDIAVACRPPEAVRWGTRCSSMR